MDTDDRKMFAPLRSREAVLPEAKMEGILRLDGGAFIPARLADQLVHSGLAVGTRGNVTRRIGEILDGLVEAGRVERTPDGRYRAVRGLKR